MADLGSVGLNSELTGGLVDPLAAPLTQPLVTQSLATQTLPTQPLAETSASNDTGVSSVPAVDLLVSVNAGTEAGATVITVTATASAAVVDTQTVGLTVTGDGITAGDFSLSSQFISIADGATSGSVTFTVLDDGLVEPLETARLTISSITSGVTLGNVTTQDISITSDDIEAPSLIVTTTADILDATDGLTSLREAINAVNSGAFAAGSTIRFAGDTDLTGADAQLPLNDPAGTKTIYLAAALNDLRITQSVNIDGDLNGDGTPDITIDADSGAGLNDADSRVFTIDGPAPVTAALSGLIIRDGNVGSGAKGGGVFVDFGDTLTLSSSTIIHNAGRDGGGVYARGATISVTTSTISNNTASGDGGGVFTNSGASLSILNSTIGDNRSNADGGGISALRSELSIVSSLFFGNTARNDGGALSTFNSLGGADSSVIANSTFTQNSAGQGGAIFNTNGTTRIEHSTITGNTAQFIGGGITSVGDNSTQTEIGSTIIAGNKSAGRGNDVATNAPNVPDFTSLGNNLIGDGQDGGFAHFTNGANNDIVGTTVAPLVLTNVFDTLVTVDPTPQLPGSGDEVQAGGLGNNGGPTQTVALKLDLSNPAIDAGGTPPTEQSLGIDVDGDGTIETTPISVDARGLARSVDFPGAANTSGPTDIGAFEAREPNSLIVTTTTDVVDAGDGLTSLREAIAFANNVADADGVNGALDTITFDQTVFANGGVIRLDPTLGTLVVSSAVKIDGAVPSGKVTITGDTGANDSLVAGTSLTDIVTSDTNTTLADNVRIFNFDANSDGSSLDRLTLTGGAALSGGAVNGIGTNLAINDSTIVGNKGSTGGGLFFSTSGFQITNSTVANNMSNSGGGLASFTDLTGPNVGQITNSTFYGNQSSGGGGAVLSFSGKVTVSNSTVTQNTASFGGGISSAGNANTSFVLQSSIVAKNTATTAGAGNDVSGTSLSGTTSSFVSGGNNLIGDGQFVGVTFFNPTNNTNDIVGTTTNKVDPLLGPFADNGGPTQTLLLREGSPAIDAGANPLSLVNDQRGTGFTRQEGAQTDIGAVEARPESPSLIVTTTADVVDVFDGLTSLREAINAINAGLFAPGSTIRFAGDSDLTGADAQLKLTDPSGAKTIFLASALNDLKINRSMTIDGDLNGDGAPDITIDADSGSGANDADSRVFSILGDSRIDMNGAVVSGPSVSASLNGLIIRDGDPGNLANGGGIFLNIADQLTLTNSVVTQNSGRNGAGIWAELGATITIIGSTLSSNTALNGTGGAVFHAGSATRLGNQIGTLTSVDSVFSGNFASASGGAFGISGGATATISGSLIDENRTSGQGGGVDSDGTGALTFVNTTLSNNVAENGGGGAIASERNSAISLINATVTGNESGANGSGVSVAGFGGSSTVTLHNSILVGNDVNVGNGARNVLDTSNAANTILIATGQNLLDGAPTGFDEDISANSTVLGSGGFLSLGDVFDSVVTRNPGTFFEFQAGGLADNGGPVQTVALKASLTNPAIDAGGTPPTEQTVGVDVDGDGTVEATPISVDARGFARSVDVASVANTTGPTDIGAFELQGDTRSLIVTTTADVVDPFDGLISLREAINAVNNGTFAAGSTIRFAEDTDLTGADALLPLVDPSGTKTIYLSAALNDLRITRSVNIDGDLNGDGTPDITIDADSGVGLNDADSRVLTIDGPAPVTAGLSGLIIRDGVVGTTGFGPSVRGGGVYVGEGDTLSLANSSVLQNSGRLGGGVHGAQGSAISITGTSISGNAARLDGGGAYTTGGASLSILSSTISDNRSNDDGGGIYVRSTPSSIVSSLFSGNTATRYGGGVFAVSRFDQQPYTMLIANSTFTQNSVGTGGGAIFSYNGPTRIEHSTITGNTAQNFGGGVASLGDIFSQIEIGSTIVAGNKSAGRGDDFATRAQNVTDFTSLGNNLIGDGQDNGFAHFTNGQNNDIVGTTTTPLSLTNVFDQVVTIDPNGTPNSGDEFQAGALADNGGAVQTVALKASLSNPAIDAGGTPPTERFLGVDVDGDGVIENTPISVDGRGFARSVDIAGKANTTSPTDIGAFETQGTSTKGPDILEGTSGNDTLDPGLGNDLVFGFGGIDLIIFDDAGSDTGIGGPGDDGFIFRSTFDPTDKVDGSAGTNDQMGLQGDYSQGITFGPQSMTNVEVLAVLSGSNTRFGAPGTERFSYNLTLDDANITANQIFRFTSTNLLASESVTLNASAEQDGQLLTFGGLGTEILTGTQRDDGFWFATGGFTAADRIDGSGGTNDQVGLQGDYSAGLTFGANQLTNVEVIVLLPSTETRFNGDSNTPFSYDLTMSDGNVASGAVMTIFGLNLGVAEALTFSGAAELDGSFKVFGGDGIDRVTGSANNDQIYGNDAADSLTGNGGNDRFVYRALTESTAQATDRIQDFSAGDVIDLSFIDANPGTAANDAFVFISGAFTNTVGELRAVNTAANAWRVEADGNGDGIADLVISLTTTDADPITAADFLL
ncbi:MAG: choice-of-anchor Q domain-containing protein [Pseudomonadota bacterium]